MGNKSHKYLKHKKNKTRKHRQKIIPNNNPPYINDVSYMIFMNAPAQEPPLDKDVSVFIKEAKSSSYSPSVNRDLVKLQSVEREVVETCNNKKAFELKEPLQISFRGKIYGKTCVPYYDVKAISFLLKNLSANKHVNPSKIVPPVQSQANCWFNTMFVSLFVSDKGRKFFHFFRQLMIEGIQSNGKSIPSELRNGFALLNYAIEACLNGDKYAYTLDTNAIVRNIYQAIPQKYKDKLPYIKNVGEAGNPLRYYGSIAHYLDDTSIQLMFIKNATEKWKEMILEELKKNKDKIPHIIVLEINDGPNGKAGVSGQITNKARSFYVKGIKYLLDSCIIRDIGQDHFCSTITCEKNEMAYDGMSFHRLVDLSWKKYINSDFSWGFEGSTNLAGKPLKWNFTHGYQMLLYYREK
jgi:hypothetical protein